MKGFNRFVLRFGQTVKQWLFFMLYLSFFRLSFILYFRNKMDPATGVPDAVLVNGDPGRLGATEVTDDS